VSKLLGVLWLLLFISAPAAAIAQDAPSDAAKPARKRKKPKAPGRRPISLDEAAQRARRGEAKPPPEVAPEAPLPETPKPETIPAAAAPPPEPVFSREFRVTTGLLEHFRSVLVQYGAWKTDPELGLVWVPNGDDVGRNFAPYVSNGHWAVTEQRHWVWVSDYPWGHITFHYGQWEWRADDGWVWVPGTTWAPAWVVWRLTPKGYDYTAWAPTPARQTYRVELDDEVPRYHATPRRVRGPLRFMFVFNQYLFSHGVGDHVIWDSEVSAWLGARSKTFKRHGASLRPASPSFAQALLPEYLTPVDRLPISHPRIAPFEVE
jgi:hypothetical protein